MGTDEPPTPEAVEAEVRELIAGAGMQEPDEFQFNELRNELIALWHEQKLAVIVELGVNEG